MLIQNIIESSIGFSSGVMIGAGFIALLTVLGVIPRLIQLSKANDLVHVFGAATVLGTLCGTFLTFTNITLPMGCVFIMIWGLFQGVFNGMIAAALTEILNVFPILAKRIKLERHLYVLLLAILFGKVLGSLFQWIVLVAY